MNRPESWKVLNEGDEGAVILAVDYNRTGRPEAGFSELVPKLDKSWAVWETLPPTSGEPAGTTGDRYVDRWIGECRTIGRPIRAVLGYCAGSVFASVMADRIGEWQGEPPVIIVFDPEMPVASGLYDDFIRATEQFESFLSAEYLARARQEGADAMLEHGDDLEMLGPIFVRIFGESAEIAFRRIGVVGDFCEQLVGAFETYVSYLVAAWRLELATATATAITSSAAGNDAGLAVKEIRFDIDQKDLLRDARVALAVMDVLGGAPPVA